MGSNLWPHMISFGRYDVRAWNVMDVDSIVPSRTR